MAMAMTSFSQKDIDNLQVKIFSLEGNIGAGKSTILKEFQKTNVFSEIKVLLEPVKEWETWPSVDFQSQGKHYNLLDEFYRDTTGFFFPFQVAVLSKYAEKFSQMLATCKPGDILLLERSFFTSYEVFCREGEMSDRERSILHHVMDTLIALYPPLGHIDGYFYLKTPPATCLERVKTREEARMEEKKIIQSHKLSRLEEVHDLWLREIIQRGRKVYLLNGIDEANVNVNKMWKTMNENQFFQNEKSKKVVGFYGGPLGNFFKSAFVVDGMTFDCVEQYFQYKKAEHFRDEETMKNIMKAKYPIGQKFLGSKVRGYNDKVWKAYRYRVMFEGCEAKFSQNPDLKTKLLNTESAILCEASPKDKVWGVGLSMFDPAIKDPKMWCGENLMGKILMELRKKFMSS